MSPLTVKQVSKILGVHENSVRNFDRRGLIKSYRDHRHYRLFDLQDVLKLKHNREMLEFNEKLVSGSTLLTHGKRQTVFSQSNLEGENNGTSQM